MSGLLKNLKYIKLYDVLSIFVFLLLIIPSLFYKLYLAITRKKIWLIAEDGRTARDNGYYFFKYMREEHKDFKAYYVIDKKSHDYKKVAKLGNIVKFRSIKHWIYYLSCKYNISSQKNGNPAQALFYVLHVKFNLFNNRVFLQHGIIMNDNNYVHYSETKFKYFICGAKREHEYVSTHFGYPEGRVLFTGLARHDYLKKDVDIKDKQILIMPTWRSWLGRETNRLSKQESFTETEFFKNWNGLLNDKDFISFVEANNITVKFYPHINMQKYLSCFQPGSSNIELVSTDTDIQKVLKESALMITDYTSASMDFALLKKPIIYFQFDQKEFREKQYTEGYFDYKKDGFGPVVTNARNVVNTIKTSWNGKTFKNESEYVKKATEFFGDENSKQTNCQKIYQSITTGLSAAEKKERARNFLQTLLVYVSMAACFAGALSFYYFYTISPLMIVAVVIFIYRLIFRDRVHHRLFRFELLYLLFLLAAAVGAYFSYSRGQSIKMFVKIAAIIFSILQCRALYYEAGKEKVIKAFCRVSFLFVIVTFILYIHGLFALNFNFNIKDIKLPGVMVDRKMPRLMTLAAPDPNSSCQFLMIPLAFLLCFFGKIKKPREKLFYILNIVCYTAAIALTLSRGGIITAVFGLVVYYIFNNNKFKTKIVATGLIIVAIILSALASVPILNGGKLPNLFQSDTTSAGDGAQNNGEPSPDNGANSTKPTDPSLDDNSFADTMTKRFLKSDGGSGRMRLWRNAIKSFKDHPLFGIGINSSNTYNAENYGGKVTVTHNMYLDVLSETGIIATFFFAVFIIVLSIVAFKLRKIDGAFSFVILMSFLASCVFLSKQYWEVFFIHVLIVDLCVGFSVGNQFGLSKKAKRNSKIKASVLLPTLNTKEEYLEKSISSILGQTHKNLELIIVVDGSNDDEFIAKKFNDNRIAVIKHKETQGIAKSLNEAIRKSTGKYLVRMDADDISEPRRIERQIAYMEKHQDIDVASTFYVKFGDKYKITCESFTKPNDIKARLFFMDTIAHPAVITRRSTMLDYNYEYDPSYEKAEDYELWNRMALDGRRFSIMRYYALFYRIHVNQVGVSKRQQQLAQVERIHKDTLTKLGIDSKNAHFMSILAGGQEKVTDKYALKKFIGSVLAANKAHNIYPHSVLKKVLWSAYDAACIRSKILVIPNGHFLAFFARKVLYKMIYNPIEDKIVGGYRNEG